VNVSHRRRLGQASIRYVAIFSIILVIPITVILSYVLFRDITIILIVQSMIIAIQMVILYIQLIILSRGRIPLIVLERSRTDIGETIINVKNLTDNPAFYIEVETLNTENNEIKENIKCDIVEYLGPREEREMCYIYDPRKFAEVVNTVKISYLDGDDNRYVMEFKVNSKEVNGEVKLSFIPIPRKHPVYI